MLPLTVSFHSISLCSAWKIDLWARVFLSGAFLSPVSTLKRGILRHLSNTSMMVCVWGSSVAAFPHLASLWLDFKSQPAADKLYLHRPGTLTSICLADGLCCGGNLVKCLPPSLCIIIKTSMLCTAAIWIFILAGRVSATHIRQSTPFQRRNTQPRNAIPTLAVSGRAPDSAHPSWQNNHCSVVRQWCREQEKKKKMKKTLGKRIKQVCLFIVLLHVNGSGAASFIKLGFERTHSSTKTSWWWRRDQFKLLPAEITAW